MYSFADFRGIAIASVSEPACGHSSFPFLGSQQFPWSAGGIVFIGHVFPCVAMPLLVLKHMQRVFFGPPCTNLTCFPWRCTCVPKMKFLGQGFRKWQHYRHTDRRHRKHYGAASWVANVIIYRSYALLKMVHFFGPPCIYRSSGQGQGHKSEMWSHHLRTYIMWRHDCNCGDGKSASIIQRRRAQTALAVAGSHLVVTEWRHTFANWSR